MTPKPHLRRIETGDLVTRAELAAHLEPMRHDITEIKGNVQALVEQRRAGAILGARGRAVVDAVATRTAIAVAAGLMGAAAALASTYL